MCLYAVPFFVLAPIGQVVTLCDIAQAVDIGDVSCTPYTLMVDAYVYVNRQEHTGSFHTYCIIITR